MKYKIFIKGFLIFISIILICSTINTSLYYFDIINETITNIIGIISLTIALFTSGFIIGKNSNNKGYINGLILSVIIIITNLIINLIINKKISIILLLTYVLITFIVTTSSIIGINKKDSSKLKF